MLISYKELGSPFVSIPSYLAGDGIVVKGQAYGIRSIRVDGNDALAVYGAIRRAREMAITEQRPILVEVQLCLISILWSQVTELLK